MADAQAERMELLDAVRAHWRAKYAGKPAELPIAPEDCALYTVSHRIRESDAKVTQESSKPS